ncbi:UNVERIFIED_CONTAM: hypothetical protein Sangu_2764700 [Sesamum angustifolium]|uniref:Uncharacterized protein n=1 Tax=Sesamum angustifolium TaxID=2727405 RepID=A0AAW2ITR3_9LAMI
MSIGALPRPGRGCWGQGCGRGPAAVVAFPALPGVSQWVLCLPPVIRGCVPAPPVLADFGAVGLAAAGATSSQVPARPRMHNPH